MKTSDMKFVRQLAIRTMRHGLGNRRGWLFWILRIVSDMSTVETSETPAKIWLRSASLNCSCMSLPVKVHLDDVGVSRCRPGRDDKDVSDILDKPRKRP